MHVTLTIIKYPTKYIPFAFLAMALFRIPLWFQKKISFYKLMGTGKNGTFDKRPDFNQWAIMAAHVAEIRDTNIEILYGKFIAS